MISLPCFIFVGALLKLFRSVFVFHFCWTAKGFGSVVGIWCIFSTSDCMESTFLLWVFLVDALEIHVSPCLPLSSIITVCNHKRTDAILWRRAPTSLPLLPMRDPCWWYSGIYICGACLCQHCSIMGAWGQLSSSPQKHLLPASNLSKNDGLVMEM